MNLAPHHDEDPGEKESAPGETPEAPTQRSDELEMAGTAEHSPTAEAPSETLSATPEGERADDFDESSSSSLGILKGVVLGVIAALIVGGIAFAVTVNRNSSSTPTPAALASTPAAIPTQGAVPTPAISGGSVAAVVNGHDIPMSKFRMLINIASKQAAANPQAGPPNTAALAQQTMNQVVADEVIREYAVAHHISVSPALLNARVQQVEQQSGGPAAFKAQLTRFGLTLNDYKQLIGPSLLGQQVEQQVVPLSTAKTTTAHVRHILVGVNLGGKQLRSDATAKVRAQQVLTRLHHGGNFAALAKQYSDDPGSKNTGGVYDVQPGQMVAQFEHAAFTLPPHQPTIVHTQFGYHIIEVLSRHQAPSPQIQQQKFSTWVRTQMNHAKTKRLAQVK